jgi:hypothetical protein
MRDRKERFVIFSFQVRINENSVYVCFVSKVTDALPNDVREKGMVSLTLQLKF